MSFTNIEVFPYSMTFGQSGKPLYRQCQAVDTQPAPAGRYGVQSVRCGATAMVIVKRTSEESGNTYEDAMCDAHAAPWQNAAALAADGRRAYNCSNCGIAVRTLNPDATRCEDCNQAYYYNHHVEREV